VKFRLPNATRASSTHTLFILAACGRVVVAVAVALDSVLVVDHCVGRQECAGMTYILRKERYLGSTLHLTAKTHGILNPTWKCQQQFTGDWTARCVMLGTPLVVLNRASLILSSNHSRYIAATSIARYCKERLSTIRYFYDWAYQAVTVIERSESRNRPILP
jgi:hypothetical protein